MRCFPKARPVAPHSLEDLLLDDVADGASSCESVANPEAEEAVSEFAWRIKLHALFLSETK